MRRALLNDVVIDLERLTKFEITDINRNQNFVCERCYKPVVFKRGTRKRAHFAHVKAGMAATSSESVAHKLVKEIMARWLRNQGIHATVEHPFPVVSRIADVYFKYNSTGYVFEIQKSSISESEFKQRIFDYERLGIEIIWIFLGEVKKQENTYHLPSVMQGRSADKLIHFCAKQAILTIFENPVYISAKEIYCQKVSKRLKYFDASDLLDGKRIDAYIDNGWLDVKRNFRRRGWFFLSKSERKLAEQCLLRGFNLAQVPPEVGWPVAGNGINKHLFIWQAYVVVCIMKFFDIGGVFGVRDMMDFLQREYQMKWISGASMQIKLYLMWLVNLGMIKYEYGYFEYIRKPKLSLSMEACLKQDAALVQQQILKVSLGS